MGSYEHVSICSHVSMPRSLSTEATFEAWVKLEAELAQPKPGPGIETAPAPLRSCPAIRHLHEDFRRSCDSCVGRVCARQAQRGLDDDGAPLPHAARPQCGARTRSGQPCRNKVVPGKVRCRMHGGASTGPKTAAGKARIAEAQRRRWERWREAKRREQGVEPGRAAPRGPPGTRTPESRD